MILQSKKLNNVCYDIRGEVLKKANQLEEEGHKITKLNIGNPAPFGFAAPDEIIQDVIRNLSSAEGYSESKGIFSARKAVMQSYQLRGIHQVGVDDIVLGNGVSELIVMAMQALINNDDEVLIPSPDYPLWTAAVNLSGGKAVHYHCDEQSDWFPDIDDIKQKITDKTKAIVVINPNNPTGAVYDPVILQSIVDIAEAHQVVVFADEIYDRILYDGTEHFPLAGFVENTLCVTFNGLSKSYRLAGFRSAWALFSGNKQQAQGFIEGFNTLSSMRLCSNVPAQLAIQTALGGYQSINDLVLPQGRLYEQRERGYELLTTIPGVSCVKPKGAIYFFPKLSEAFYQHQSDERLILDFLIEEKVLLVQGSAFNLQDNQHLRIVFLPDMPLLEDALSKLARFLAKKRQC